MADATITPQQDDLNRAAVAFVMALASDAPPEAVGWTGVTAALKLFAINNDVPGLQRSIARIKFCIKAMQQLPNAPK